MTTKTERRDNYDQAADENAAAMEAQKNAHDAAKGAPDVKAARKKVADLQTKRTDIGVELGKAERELAYAEAADHLETLTAAHKDADGDHVQQKALQSQIDAHVATLPALKARAKA